MAAWCQFRLPAGFSNVERKHLLLSLCGANFTYLACFLKKDKNKMLAGPQWLTPVILATQETEIRRIMVQSQPWQIVHKTLSRKKPFTKKGWWSGSRCSP
jgi:hypothetical protein